MKERLRSWLPVVPLILLLGAMYWLNSQVQEPGAVSGKSLRHDPDYTVDNFTATTLDKNGKIRFVMSAQKMQHYPDDDTTHLDNPRIISHAAEYPAMRMSALNGEISSKGEEVILRNEVNIVRPAYSNKSEMTFNTSMLRILPNQDIVNTDQPVTMKDARLTLHAVGMELDHKAHTVKFLSQVKSTYEPAKK